MLPWQGPGISGKELFSRFPRFAVDDAKGRTNFAVLGSGSDAFVAKVLLGAVMSSISSITPDTGVSSSDAITKDPTLLIHGIAIANRRE